MPALVAQYVECQLRDREVPGSIPGRDIPVVNNGSSCSPLGTRIFGVGLGLVAPVSV